MPDRDYGRSFGFLMSDISRLMRTYFDRRARALGLTRAQWRVLAQLGRNEGIHQSALAEILEIENITLGRHVDRLEEAGWVERRRDPNDRRVWRLHMTKKAYPIFDGMRVLITETENAALDGFDLETRHDLLDALTTIKNNLVDAELVVSDEDEEEEAPAVTARAVAGNA